jgi:hypothetical protein
MHAGRQQLIKHIGSQAGMHLRVHKPPHSMFSAPWVGCTLHQVCCLPSAATITVLAYHERFVGLPSMHAALVVPHVYVYAAHTQLLHRHQELQQVHCFNSDRHHRSCLNSVVLLYAAVRCLPSCIPTATATQLLRRRHYQPRHRRQALRLALLAASFAALKLHPPQLFRAIGELYKQQRQQLKLLGPTESMLLLWAFGRVGHTDAPAQLLLTQRAATQVGFGRVWQPVC